MKLIERVQQIATKLLVVQSSGHLRYDDRLEYLGLTHLDRGRIRGDSAETYTVFVIFYKKA